MIGLADTVTSVPPVPLQVRLRFPALFVLVAALVLATVVSLPAARIHLRRWVSQRCGGRPATHDLHDIRVPRVVLRDSLVRHLHCPAPR